MASLQIRGAELFVETIGQTVGAGPPILMLHGLGLDHTYLRAHDALADRHRVIYYDQRFNGRSSRDRGTADHATWHADAIGVLDALGHDRAVVYGHSYGSWLALGLALRHPERVAGLVLCGSSPAFDYTPDVIANAQARDPVAAAALIAGLTTPVATDAAFGALWHAILPLYFAGLPRPALLADTRFSAHAFAAGTACLAGFDVTAQLPALAMPVRLLTGAHDYITPPVQAQRIADRVRGAEHVVLPASGHFPFAEEHDAYTGLLRGWLATIA